jgi:hypothetical protein
MGSAKCKFVPILFLKCKKIGASEECLKFAGRILLDLECNGWVDGWVDGWM